MHICTVNANGIFVNPELMPTPSTRHGRPPSDQNTLILAAYREGEPMNKIGERFEISRQRVQQIVKAANVPKSPYRGHKPNFTHKDKPLTERALLIQRNRELAVEGKHLCSKCEEAKDICQFSVTGRTKNKVMLAPYCKPCAALEALARYHNKKTPKENPHE